MRKYILIASIALAGCEKISVKNELLIPENYNGISFETNAANELLAREALNSFSNEMKKGRKGLKIENSSISQYLNELRPLTSNYYLKLIDENLLPELFAANTGKALTFGEEGGIYGAYLFNKYGIENEQLIEKGLYASTFYNKAYSITTETRDHRTTDRILALFGANPSFANSNNATLHSKPDIFIANYVARRDRNDGKGFYTNIQLGLIQLQAAINGGGTYLDEQNEAVTSIFQNWEKGSAATAINYIYSILSKLSATNPDDEAKASALHSFSEVLGFLHGFKSVNQKIITDKEIDEILLLMNVPVGETPKTLNFLSQPASELPKILQVLSKLQTVYGFKDSEMEDFKKNWVSEQNR